MCVCNWLDLSWFGDPTSFHSWIYIQIDMGLLYIGATTNPTIHRLYRTMGKLENQYNIGCVAAPQYHRRIAQNQIVSCGSSRPGIFVVTVIMVISYYNIVPPCIHTYIGLSTVNRKSVVLCFMHILKVAGGSAEGSQWSERKRERSVN